MWKFVGSSIFKYFKRLRSYVNPTFVRVVCLDMSDVVPGEFVDGLLDLGQTALLAHLLRREVGVRASAAPLTLKRRYITLELAIAAGVEFQNDVEISKQN